MYFFSNVIFPFLTITIPQIIPNVILKKSTPIILPKYFSDGNIKTKTIDNICDIGNANKL